MLRIIVLLLLVSGSAAYAECSLNRAEFREVPSPNYQVWEFKDSSFLWDDISTPETAFSNYQQTISNLIQPLDALLIIQKQYPLFMQDPKPSMKAEAFNASLVLNGGAGTIRKISCLESLMIQEQTALFPLADYPYEFLAAIFKKYVNGVARVKIILHLGVSPFQKPVQDDIKVLLAEGWSFWAHIHNHPFYLEKYPDQIFQGLMTPSLSDVQLYRSWASEFGQQNALITNGFHTIQIPASDFNKFCSWDDEGKACFPN